jgi:phage-related protein
MTNVGSWFVDVVPSFKGVAAKMQAETTPAATEAGSKAGKGFSDAFAASTKSGAANAAAALEASVKRAEAAVTSSSQRIIAARAREEAAAGKVRVAEAQLAEAREKHAAGSSQVIAAEERLATAQRNVTTTAGATQVATAKLNAAKSEASALASKTVDDAGKESVALARTKTIMADTSPVIGGLISQYGKLGAAVGVAVVLGIGVHAVKAAGDFQSSQERLVTTAGELQSNLKLVGDGVLTMAGQVGYSAQTLSTGLYTVESAGYHGAEALKVMQAAAEGAKTENADLTTVTDAVTSAMQDYHFGADQAAEVTSKMVTAVGDGKTTFEQLTGAMSAILPKAASAHVGLDEILGDLSAMTLHGVSAQQASQNLADALSHLANPTLAQTKELAALGLSAADLSKNLGKTGVSGAMLEIEQAVLQHMGPAGTTMLNAFNQSRQAAADAKTMFENLPPAAHKVAQAVLDGSLSFKEFRKSGGGLAVDQKALVDQWFSVQKSASGFSDVLKTGGNATQTFSQAMAKATGDSASLNVALMLTGENAATVQKNIKDVAGASAEAGGHVKGWAEVQGTFNQKIDEVKAGIGAWVIQMGTALLPMLTGFVGSLQGAAHWLSENKTWVGLVAAILGGMLVPLIAIKAAYGAWFIATKIMAGAQLALNLVMSANPVFLIITAIAALVAGIIYAYTHFEGFRKVLDAIGGVLKTVFLAVIHAVGTAIGWVVDHWKIFAAVLAVVFAPITALVGLFLLVKNHLHDIGDAATWVYEHGIKPAFKAISDVVSGFVGWIVTTWHKITAPIVDEWNKISMKLKEIWAALVDLWNQTGGRLVQWISSHMTEIKRVFTLIWNAISLEFRAIWAVISGIVGGALSVILGILRVGWNIVSGVFKFAWDYIVTILKVAWDVIKGVFGVAFAIIKGIVVGAWDVIVGIFTIAWQIIKGVINTALDIIKGIIKIFTDIVTGNWSKLWTDIKSLVTTVLKDVWDVIKGVFGAIWDTIKSVGQNMFNTLADVWNSIKSTVLSVAGDLWKGLKTGIQDAVDVLGSIWDGLKKAFGTPIEFMIRTVLNGGLIKGINTLLDVVGLSIPNIPDPNLPTFEHGGIVPGSGPIDSVLARVTPGEGILTPATVQGIGGARAIAALNSRFGGSGGPALNDGLPGFGLGGVVSSIIGGIGDALSSLKNVALGGLRSAAQGFFDSVVKPLIGEIPGGPNNIATRFLGGMAGKIEDDILKFLGQKDQTATASASGGAAPTNVSGAIALGQSMAASRGWVGAQWDALYNLWQGESGWNPLIANGSSGAYGIPQALPGTKMASAGADWRTNPATQIRWGLDYIGGRYNNPASAYGQWLARHPHWYDNGGWLQPGVTATVNATGRPEAVLTEGQWATVRTAMSRQAGGGDRIYNIHSYDPASVVAELQRLEHLEMVTNP